MVGGEKKLSPVSHWLGFRTIYARKVDRKNGKGRPHPDPAETGRMSLPIISSAQERNLHGVLHSTMRIRSFVTLLAARSRDQL